MGRVGNFAGEDGSRCLIMFIMEEYLKVEVQDKGGGVRVYFVFKNQYLRVDLPCDGVDYVVSESDFVLRIEMLHDRFFR